MTALIIRKNPSGNCVSACRNSSTSPVAAAAPAFICRARPGGDASTLSANGAARAAVASVLPPSTTMISSWSRRACNEPSTCVMPSASLRTGITTESQGIQLPKRQLWNLATHCSSFSGACARFHSPAANLLASLMVG